MTTRRAVTYQTFGEEYDRVKTLLASLTHQPCAAKQTTPEDVTLAYKILELAEPD